jgi:glycogen debranching enzyme
MSDSMPGPSGLLAPDHLPVFYIRATTSLQERRSRTLKHGETFAVFDHNGDILEGPASPEGLFHADTRHLSLCALTLGGLRPLLLSSTLRADNATLTCDLTNQDLFQGERLVLLLQCRPCLVRWNCRR